MVAFVAAAGCFEWNLAAGAPSAHSRMNVEGIAAVALVAAAVGRSGRGKALAAPPKSYGFRRRSAALVFFVIAALALMAFGRIFQIPFLYDDYTHITEAAQHSSEWPWHWPLLYFGRVADPPGLFFRPVGFVLYELSYLWAGIDAARWHALSLMLHAACACLTFVLCRKVGAGAFASLAGALLFLLNGCTAEAVAWVDARFDLIVTFLALLCLLSVLQFAESGRCFWLGIGCLLQALAILTKESAFCLPLLVGCLALFCATEYSGRMVFASILSSGLALGMWIYRWWALGGIGGYRGPEGLPAVTRFHPLQTLEALFLRQWAILLFPVNWASAPGIALRGALAMLPMVWIACVLLSRKPVESRVRLYVGAAGMAILASLPVQHLLLVGPDLSGSFRIYLPSVGLAIFWSRLFDGMPARPRIAMACILMAIHAAILEHNLAQWRSTAELAKGICVSFGRSLERSADTVWVKDLPAKRMGVVFLANGFPQCVAMNSGVDAGRIQVAEAGRKPAPGARVFRWNEQRAELERARVAR
ncbi:MAG TPA: hypothetical protein VKV17_20985 [Bryobacteraceae bacterium]|nr:hypothetical protein [Bryobacteraceae bacterium]